MNSRRQTARPKRPSAKKVIAIVVVILAAVMGVTYAYGHKAKAPDAKITDSSSVSTGSQPAASSSTQPATAAAPNPCTANTLSQLILVSLSQQHLWACQGSSVVQSSAVTTGTTAIVNGVDDATPTGTWHIYAKETDQHLTGSDANGNWDDFVNYWMPFYGAYGFHDATWQTFPFGSSDYHTNGSHGCVHLPLAVAKWMYDWAQIGTTVTVEN